MKVLVTGGLGLVGRALARRLIGSGHEVRLSDRADAVRTTGGLGGAETVAGDITDFAAMREHVRGMDAVVHLAALTTPDAGPPQDVYLIGAAGTFNVYEAAAQEGIRRVVSASSINALGFNFGVKLFPIEYLPIDEEHPTFTTDVYSLTKQEVEALGAYYWRRDGISGTQIRLPFIYDNRWAFEHPKNAYMLEARDAYAELAALPDVAQRAVVADVLARKEEIRKQRLNEAKQPPVAFDPGAVRPPDHYLRYTDFWTALSADDAAQAFERSLTASYDGSHPLHVCEARNIVGQPSAWLAELFFPEARLKHSLAGEARLVSFAKAAELIGFRPEVSVGAWLAEQGVGQASP